MITLTSDNYDVTYQHDAMFRWSYNPVTVRFNPEGSDVLDYIDLTISDVNGNNGVTFRRYFPKNGVVTFDISRGLQAIGQEEVKMTVADIAGNEVSAYIYSLDGSNSVIAPYGADERQVRVWEGIETILRFFYKNKTTVRAMYKGVDTPVGVFTSSSKTGYGWCQFILKSAKDMEYVHADGVKYDGKDFISGVEWKYRLNAGCPARGESIYLRWIDTTGLRWFWLFQINQKTITTERLVEYGITPNVGASGLVNEFGSEERKIIKQRVMVGTYNVTKDEYKVVGTLFTSVKVDAYDAVAKRWYRIKVASGERIAPKGNYRDVELDIEFAPENTQLP